MVLPFWILLTVLIYSSMVSPRFESKLLFMGNETDRLSLLAFKNELTGYSVGTLSSWNESTHFCKWFGVTCGRRHQRVTVLNLSSSQLAGVLSPHLGNLSFLRVLDLKNNSFTREIPQELGRLHHLETLVLTNNSLSGEIPANISFCYNLQVLKLYSNNLTGKIPAELGSLSKLGLFMFGPNNIDGEIPPSLGNLSSLLEFYGSYNSLRGSIPDSLGQLHKLKFLGLAVNHLTGMIPPSLYNLSSMMFYSLSANQLEGALPSDLGLLFPNIEILELSINRLHGPIPVTISNASKLSQIELSSNNFHGKVPPLAGLDDLMWLTLNDNQLESGEDNSLNFLSYLVNYSKLEILDFGYNNFKGLLPQYISNFSRSLSSLRLVDNRIWGQIPSRIGNLIGLNELRLASNRLTGTIPESLGELPNLNVLYLDSNELSGSIPSSLGNITSLTQLAVADNHLTNSIPKSLGKLKNLIGLYLSNNQLSDSIPKEIMSLSSLSIALDLSNNRLTGSIPLEISHLAALSGLSFSNNKLSGDIPTSLGRCISLEEVYLGGNSLQGPVPESLSSLRAIRTLNLSRNNFSGEIPEFLADFRLLKVLDVSFNDFEGEVPIKGVFNNASAVFLLGNKKLCGGVPQLRLPRCISNESKIGNHSAKLRIIIGVSSGLFLGLTLLFLFLMLYRSKKVRNKAVSTPSVGISFPRITYGDLFRATDGFSSSNLIGAGGFGSVYKGTLRQEGTETTVAVKVLNLERKGAYKSFIAECEALRGIKHRNLVKTLTVCSSTDYSGNDFKALVYEFMVNGSLEEWLHPVQLEDPPRSLDLTQRLTIAIDVASAIDYLHNQCSNPIVHRDLKPNNVLLDDDMVAHIGDFGLARILPEHLSSNQVSSAGFRGSIGYAAPEYAMGGEVSTSSDVYSYGILLLEMFTGKKPTDERFEGGLNLRGFVEAALPEGVVNVADPILLQDTEVRESSIDRSLECLVLILRIGLACSAEMPRDRISLANAMSQLSSIRDKLLRVGLRRNP